MIVSDNGTELTSNAILKWCAVHKIEWQYIAPGKPMQPSTTTIASSRRFLLSAGRARSMTNGWRLKSTRDFSKLFGDALRQAVPIYDELAEVQPGSPAQSALRAELFSIPRLATAQRLADAPASM